MAHTYNIRPSLFNGLLFRIRREIFQIGYIVTCIFCFNCATAAETMPVQPSTIASLSSMEVKWGIRPESVRLSAGGFMIDFRYRITDSAKASVLLKEKELKPRLVDMASRAVLSIHELDKVGAMRTSFKNIVANKEFFMMFANPNRFIKRGNRVAIVIGEFRMDNLVVQ